jgi:hypothetical protein
MGGSIEDQTRRVDSHHGQLGGRTLPAFQLPAMPQHVANGMPDDHFRVVVVFMRNGAVEEQPYAAEAITTIAR